ncbi:MAG TPA: aminotransferase class III-fold pyridoxal phosphate-dependent enzyme, partial [Limnochordia bacterium]|nr:aminotransferase class III-fold pyridoxal phosphate-dependent enzyme [Limnochordia bacterium]
NYGLSPDIVTVAKGLGGGVPIGAMLATDAAATGFEPGSHASTFGGNPLACAAGLAVFEALEAGDLIAQAQVRGAYLRARLGELAGRFGAIREIRGLGLMVGVELDVPATPIFKACQANGLLINAINDRVLRFLPPLIVSEAEIDQAVAIVSGALQTAVAV